MSEKIQVRTEAADETSAVVVGPWPSERRHDVLTFSSALYEDGVKHVLDPMEHSVRIPLDSLSFEQIRDVVVRCAELINPLR